MRVDIRNATLLIQDGTATPLEVEVKFGEGNITWDENSPYEYLPERGEVAAGTVRFADQEPLSVSVEGIFENLISNGAEDVTVYEILKRVGAASAYVSTGSDPCEPYAVDLVLMLDTNCTGGAAPLGEIITFAEFRVESISPDVRGGTLNFSGKCKNVAPTIIRSSF